MEMTVVFYKSRDHFIYRTFQSIFWILFNLQVSVMLMNVVIRFYKKIFLGFPYVSKG